MTRKMFSIVLVAALALFVSQPAHARNEITVIAPGSAKAALEKLIPPFESKTGYKVVATGGTGLGTKKRVIDGEPFDVPIMQTPLDQVLASGNVDIATQTPLVTVSVAVVVRKGAPRPDISTPEAVKRMLLAAKSVSYPDAAIGAAVGLSIDDTLRKLGIYEQVHSKCKLTSTGGAAMALVASGEIEVGMTFLSEITDPGVDLLGSLPLEISTPTGLVGFVSTHAKDKMAARQLLDFLSSPSVSAIYKSLGYNPSH